MEDETDRLIRLVNDLLILSRADSEALNLQRQPVDLAHLAQATAGKLALPGQGAGHCPAGGGRPRRSPGPGRPGPHRAGAGQPAGQRHQVLPARRNGDGPRCSGTQGQQVRVEVQDQGIGIPAEELPRIGERFYRADRARSRAEGGSGLGLAIAQALVQAHGGHLSLESEEGQGTLATFTLPTA